jgi:TfoX/Sxy family transcriptional regulator of competence genes
MMASDQQTVDYICGQMAGAGLIAARKMFGEYGVYCEGIIVGLICDNQLFLKPVPAVLALMPQATLAPAYPGGKPQVLVDEGLDDPETLVQAVRLIVAVAPAPKPKKPKPARKS